MWRSSFLLLKQGLSSTLVTSKPYRYRSIESSNHRLCNCLFSTTVAGDGVTAVNNGGDSISVAEVKKLMQLVNVEALKTRFGTEGREVIGYSELLQVFESIGVAKSVEEAKKFASVLDEAGDVLIFRDKVYLHPEKVIYMSRIFCGRIGVLLDIKAFGCAKSNVCRALDFGAVALYAL